MPAAIRRFAGVARQQQGRFRETLSAGARAPADDKGKRHAHLLAHGHEIENLYPSLREPPGAIGFFADRGIQWWTNARSGDRPLCIEYAGPTRNLASSQVCCLNFILPLVSTPGALLALMRLVDPEIQEIEEIVDGQGHSSPVEFEWVGWREPLEGGRITRGANQTSIDALVVGRTAIGRRAYLIEWKYCEEYRHAEYLGDEGPGATRRARYEHLYRASESSFTGTAPFEHLLYDPLYQLMRMVLLGDRMLAEGVTEELQIDDFRVVVACPSANQDYRQIAPGSPLGQRWGKGGTVQDLMRSALKIPERMQVVAQEDLVEQLRGDAIDERLRPWLDYHRLRYGW